jgi:transposase-like protein
MGRKPRIDRSPEEKWQIVQEGIKSGHVSEKCRRHGIAPNRFYRRKHEAEPGAKTALGGEETFVFRLRQRPRYPIGAGPARDLGPRSRRQS